MAQRQCTATTKSGDRCRAPALPNDDQCFTHSPAVAAKRDARNRRGGRNKDNAARAAKQWVAIGHDLEAAEVPALLRGLMAEVVAGRVQPSVATAVATLAKTSIKLSRDLEIEQRLNALQERVGIPAEPLGHGVHQRRLDQIEEQLDAILLQRMRVWADTLSNEELVTHRAAAGHFRAGGDIATLPEDVKEKYVVLVDSWVYSTTDNDGTEA